MMSHYVADYLWHGLADVPKGFINVDAALNFFGNYDKAHANCDVGGDIVTVYENDLSYKVFNWSIPFEDIMQVYIERGHTKVSREILAKCTMELYIGDIAERWADKLLLAYATKSPFLMEQFQDYHVGGVEDM